MEKFVEQTFLFDFYGELLTERQRQVYTSVVFEDYSYEEKLHLVEKFLNIRSQVMKIHELADKYHAEDIAAISNVILEEL